MKTVLSLCIFASFCHIISGGYFDNPNNDPSCRCAPGLICVQPGVCIPPNAQGPPPQPPQAQSPQPLPPLSPPPPPPQQQPPRQQATQQQPPRRQPSRQQPPRQQPPQQQGQSQSIGTCASILCAPGFSCVEPNGCIPSGFYQSTGSGSQNSNNVQTSSSGTTNSRTNGRRTTSPRGTQRTTSTTTTTETVASFSATTEDNPTACRFVRCSEGKECLNGNCVEVSLT